MKRIVLLLVAAFVLICLPAVAEETDGDLPVYASRSGWPDADHARRTDVRRRTNTSPRTTSSIASFPWTT